MGASPVSDASGDGVDAAMLPASEEGEGGDDGTLLGEELERNIAKRFLEGVDRVALVIFLTARLCCCGECLSTLKTK